MTEQAAMILSGAMAFIALLMIAYVIGYHAAKRFSVLMVKREMKAMHLDGGTPSAAARVIGAIEGRPAGWVQNELNEESLTG